MSAEPIDLAAVKAEHELHRASPNTGLCTILMGGSEHCLPYRLAVEAERLAGKVARVESLADKWEHGALRWSDPLPVPPQVGQVRAALAGQPEQVQP